MFPGCIISTFGDPLIAVIRLKFLFLQRFCLSNTCQADLIPISSHPISSGSKSVTKDLNSLFSNLRALKYSDYIGQAARSHLVWLRMIFLFFFYILKEAHIYLCCLGERCNAVLPWSSTRLFHQHVVEIELSYLVNSSFNISIINVFSLRCH